MSPPSKENVAQLLQALRQEFNNPQSNPDKCQDYLTQLKIQLAELGLLDALTADSQGLVLARDVLEIGAYWSIRMKDIPSFERYILQLAIFYQEGLRTQLPPSSSMYPLIGLNLLRLLSQSRVADFHTALELIDPSELNRNPFIHHPLQLEQALMEGSYKRVWNSRTEVPAPEYTFFMDILTLTIRNEIASSCEKAYDSLPLEDAAALLFFSRPEEVQAFAQERGWRMNQINRRVYFGNSETDVQEFPIPKIVSQTLTYAQELEKIV
ncbi:regulatory particle non-ATPase [Dimargaris cristalligena]|uniref:COP9 signalosome n=1 Tax=Dimargaris cristalligena TaxID=215637 RepID=A0A4Q0A188_9FUNG|nr:regulatory particle non-ATPase [Dimargaris cristalligena]RKP39221.1 COP9 signalosome [Dimargaris cristalligena]|eukprot:RKP39221.1 COP9 signalosome [Dimargaris cristalligena]